MYNKTFPAMCSYFFFLINFLCRIPDETGWRDKSTRIIADELAFSTQHIVVVPAIDLGESDAGVTRLEATVSQGLKLQRWSLRDNQLSQLIDTMRFVCNEYDSRSISLVGVGCGGGAALEAATEISTLAECYRVSSGQANHATTAEEDKKNIRKKRKLEFQSYQSSPSNIRSDGVGYVEGLTPESHENGPVQVGSAVVIGKHQK